jgi:hypothetical protein
LEETLSVGTVSCVARSASALVKTDGAKTAINNGANRISNAEAKGHAALYISIISRRKKKY